MTVVGHAFLISNRRWGVVYVSLKYITLQVNDQSHIFRPSLVVAFFSSTIHNSIMSLPVEHCIFLPRYLLEYTTVDNLSSGIDSEAFLSKATPTQLVEKIFAFHPHFEFTENAKENHELLCLVFLKMVASRLSNVVNIKSDTNYLQAPLRSLAL